MSKIFFNKDKALVKSIATAALFILFAFSNVGVVLGQQGQQMQEPSAQSNQMQEPSDSGTLQINPPSIGGNQLPGNAFDLLNQVINFLTLKIMPIVISMVILWAAYLFLTAGGDPKKINTAKQALFWAIIGAVVIIIGQGIILVVKSFFGLSS